LLKSIECLRELTHVVGVPFILEARWLLVISNFVNYIKERILLRIFATVQLNTRTPHRKASKQLIILGITVHQAKIIATIRK
jgi:hypothetical protein